MHKVNGRTALKIVGPATIARGTDIRDQIANAVAQARDVDIEFDTEEIDFAVLQILVSASRSMRDQGGVLTLARPPAEPLRAMLADGGFTHNDSTQQSWDVEVTR